MPEAREKLPDREIFHKRFFDFFERHFELPLLSACASIKRALDENPLSIPSAIPHPFAVSFRDKIISWDDLPKWRAQMRQSGRKLVVTNGCFDLLHAGHVAYLENARKLGDILLIGLNGDKAVRELKGEGRPINDEEDRAALLAALESVSGVCVFQEKRATSFLSRAEPDIYVKGGDYTLDTLDPSERKAVEKAGGKIVIIPFVPGKSTTATLAKIARL